MTAVAGKRLKQVREARNLSLQQLADDAGVNLSTLWRIESGRTVPSTDTARKIAETLGVSTLWLLGESDTEDDQFSLMNLSGDERELLAAIRARNLRRALGMDGFWRQPPMRVNQLLHRLFGPRRAVIVRDGQAVGIGRALFRPKRL